ncbi:MAG: hypothetical protein IJS99_08475 [Synergistaceae bacterium]|nr:hypothetical protein [Synergistaceae bacterium]
MKKFALIIAILIFCASSSFADINLEQQVKNDSRFSPYIEDTINHGAKLLPGRYAHVGEVEARTRREKFLAPTNVVLEIARFSMQKAAYPVKIDSYNERNNNAYMTLDTSGEVPILRTFAQNGEIITEDFAVVISDGNKYVWCLCSTETGEVHYIYPLNHDWFPANWYVGTWDSSDGINLEIHNDKIFASGNFYGTFSAADNRLEITTAEGKREVIFAMIDPETGNLVATFTNAPNGMGENAVIFTRSRQPRKPLQQIQPRPMIQPRIQTSRQAPAIYGRWESVVDNQKWVMIYDENNNYRGWINGTPSESGVFQLNGNILTGRNSLGVEFTAEIEILQAGNILIMKFPDGSSINYHRAQ